MLENIKTLMQVKEHIEEIKRASVQNRDSMIALSQEVEGFKKRFNEHRGRQDELLKLMADSHKAFEEAKEELKNEVYDFKLLKAELQKSILAKFEEEVRGSITKELEKLRNDTAAFNELKERVSVIAAKTQALAAEIDKFVQISHGIRQKDFELERFARQLLEMDREKLELMRKIDTLERLVARMRQGG